MKGLPKQSFHKKQYLQKTFFWHYKHNTTHNKWIVKSFND